MTTLADANADIRICAAKARQGCHEKGRRLLFSADLGCSRRYAGESVACAWAGTKTGAPKCALVPLGCACSVTGMLEPIESMNQAPC